MELKIVKITEDIDVDKYNFDNGSIKELLRHAYYYQVKKISCTQCIKLDDTVIGFYQLKIITIDDSFEPECNDKYSAVLLNCIYIMPEYRNNGYGTAILEEIIAQILDLNRHISIRFLMIYALSDRVNWYKKCGFETVKTEETLNTMTFDFRDTTEYSKFCED